jgi:hypothetical protein
MRGSIRSHISIGGKSATWRPGAAIALAVAVVAACLLATPALAHAGAPAAKPSITSVVPSISSITVTGYPHPATPTITVAGSGFGSAPTGGIAPSALGGCGPAWSGTGMDYGRSNLWLLDTAQSVGLYGAWQNGANFSHNAGNCEGVVIDTWTTTKVVFGFGSTYGSHSWGLSSGNTVCVEVRGVPGCLTLP